MVGVVVTVGVVVVSVVVVAAVVIVVVIVVGLVDEVLRSWDDDPYRILHTNIHKTFCQLLRHIVKILHKKNKAN